MTTQLYDVDTINRLYASNEALVATLEEMVDLFDHTGLRGLIAGAKEHGWTEQDAILRGHACIRARIVITKAKEN